MNKVIELHGAVQQLVFDYNETPARQALAEAGYKWVDADFRDDAYGYVLFDGNLISAAVAKNQNGFWVNSVSDYLTEDRDEAMAHAEAALGDVFARKEQP